MRSIHYQGDNMSRLEKYATIAFALFVIAGLSLISVNIAYGIAYALGM